MLPHTELEKNRKHRHDGTFNFNMSNRKLTTDRFKYLELTNRTIDIRKPDILRRVPRFDEVIGIQQYGYNTRLARDMTTNTQRVAQSITYADGSSKTGVNQDVSLAQKLNEVDKTLKLGTVATSETQLKMLDELSKFNSLMVVNTISSGVPITLNIAKSLTPAGAAMITPIQAATIDVSMITAMSVPTIAAMTDKAFSGLSQDVIRAIPADVFALLNAAQLKEIPSDIISPTQLEKIKPSELKGVDLSKLLPVSVAAITPLQAPAIDLGDFKGVDPSFIPDDTLIALNDDIYLSLDLATILRSQKAAHRFPIAKAPPADFGSIDPILFSNLSNTQLGRMTAAQAPEMTKDQAKALPVNAQKLLSKDFKDNLDPDVLRAIPIPPPPSAPKPKPASSLPPLFVPKVVPAAVGSSPPAPVASLGVRGAPVSGAASTPSASAPASALAPVASGAASSAPAPVASGATFGSGSFVTVPTLDDIIAPLFSDPSSFSIDGSVYLTNIQSEILLDEYDNKVDLTDLKDDVLKIESALGVKPSIFENKYDKGVFDTLLTSNKDLYNSIINVAKYVQDRGLSLIKLMDPPTKPSGGVMGAIKGFLTPTRRKSLSGGIKTFKDVLDNLEESKLEEPLKQFADILIINPDDNVAGKVSAKFSDGAVIEVMIDYVIQSLLDGTLNASNIENYVGKRMKDFISDKSEYDKLMDKTKNVFTDKLNVIDQEDIKTVLKSLILDPTEFDNVLNAIEDTYKTGSTTTGGNFEDDFKSNIEKAAKLGGASNPAFRGTLSTIFKQLLKQKVGELDPKDVIRYYEDIVSTYSITSTANSASNKNRSGVLYILDKQLQANGVVPATFDQSKFKSEVNNFMNKSDKDKDTELNNIDKRMATAKGSMMAT